MSWQKEVEEFLIDNNYDKLVSFYEDQIEINTENLTNYIYLGLAYLLQGNESEAQTTWFYILTENNQKLTNQLIEILDREAERQVSIKQNEIAWLIRSYLKEINSELVNNILSLIDLEIKLKKYVSENLITYNLESLLQNVSFDLIDLKLLWEVLPKIIIISQEKSLEITEISLQNHLDNLSICIDKINEVALYFSYQNSDLAISLTNLCLQLKPNDWQLSKNLCWYYFYSGNSSKAIILAKEIYDKAKNIGVQVYLNSILLDLMHKSNLWLECQQVFQRHKILLETIIKKDKYSYFYKDGLVRLIRPLLHSEDNPRENRSIQNRLTQLFEENIKANYQINKSLDTNFNKQEKKKLKIGYIGYTFRTHSVGWLCRWLFHYHDREKFEIYIYLVNQLEDEMTKKWFKNNVDYCYSFTGESEEIAQQIFLNNIDILIDLDAITNQTTCGVMSLKPALIQVTWLGSDASGISSIDYFIADPYVLPDDAQEYYGEKIWRLPHSYLAIDGFEVDVLTLTREDLKIPSDAIIYLNIQNAFKRHPDIIHLQMKIIKAVPNSYLLIKGSGDKKIVQSLYIAIAKEEEVEKSRLRFLDMTPTEESHRANLRIADIVLDTYPYNGATTTLETLWMEIPLVTRVGEQFAARNSYTFMMNAGITEGIAWSDEEYVEWGIKLGTDEELRKEISWKLKQSKKTSPLWNGKQFTREMEKAYQQMWEIYVDEQKI